MGLISLLRRIFGRMPPGFQSYEPTFRSQEPQFKIESIQSQTERVLLNSFKKYGLNPEPQYKIGNMRVDFAFPQEKIVIEVDGVHHNGEEQKIKDIRRGYFLKDSGWKIWRYKAEHCYKFPDYIARKIRERLNS